MRDFKILRRDLALLGVTEKIESESSDQTIEGMEVDEAQILEETAREIRTERKMQENAGKFETIFNQFSIEELKRYLEILEEKSDGTHQEL